MLTLIAYYFGVVTGCVVTGLMGYIQLYGAPGWRDLATIIVSSLFWPVMIGTFVVKETRGS